jgi:hypothetical protein
MTKLEANIKRAYDVPPGVVWIRDGWIGPIISHRRYGSDRGGSQFVSLFRRSVGLGARRL